MANRFVKIDRKRITIDLPLWAYTELKKRASDNDISMNSIITELLKKDI